MRDWELYVRERLGEASWDEKTLSRVATELSEMMLACERDALDGGASPKQARAAARAQVPDWKALIKNIKETERSATPRASSASRQRRSKLFSGIGKDLRTSLRTLRKHPGFAAVVIVTLALGVGANAAIFSMVDAVLLTPLPYENPEELVRLFSTHSERSIERMGVSTGDVVDWRRRNGVFDGIGAWYVMGRTLSNEQKQRNQVARLLQKPH